MTNVKKKSGILLPLLLALFMLAAFVPLMSEQVHADVPTDYPNVVDPIGYNGEYDVTISTNKAEYEIGEDIYVKIDVLTTGSYGSAFMGGDPWIGLMDYNSEGQDQKKAFAWAPITGSVTGKVINNANSPDKMDDLTIRATIEDPGTYYLMANATDGRYACCQIVVGAVSDPTVTVDKTSYKYGEDINVTTNYNGTSLPTGTFVGVYPADTTSYGKTVVWYYPQGDGAVKKLQDITESNLIHGIGTLSSDGFTAGEYQVGYFSGSDAPYTLLYEVATFSVYYEYLDPEWSWAQDYSSATATFKADGLPSEEKTITDNNPSASVTTAATCTATGTKTHTASVTVSDFTTKTGTTTFTDTATETLPALGHDYGEWTTVTPATEDEAGLERRVCSRDASHVDEREIPKLSHVHAMNHVEAVAATCEGAGNSEYYECTGCGKFFSDENGENEIDENSWEIPAINHSWGEWTYDAENKKHTRVCGNDAKHTQTEDCTFDGGVVNDGVRTYTCSACGGTYTETLISTDKDTYGFNDPIMVTSTGSGKDWVGLFNKDDVPREGGPTSYYYFYPAEHSNQAVDIKTTTFQHSITGGGEYKLVLLANDGYDVIASIPITIEEPESSLAIDKSTYTYGDPINVTASSDYSDAWVGFYDYEEELTDLDKPYYRFDVADHSGEAVNIIGLTKEPDAGAITAKRYRVVMIASPGVVDIKTFTIQPKSLDSADITVEPIDSQVHTGEAVEPKITVKDGETVLKKGTDYDLTYGDNVEVGTATVTIEGKGNYKGNPAEPVSFEITHDLTAVPKVPATETEDGTEAYWKCKICGDLFSDAEGKNSIDAPVVIPKTGGDDDPSGDEQAKADAEKAGQTAAEAAKTAVDSKTAADKAAAAADAAKAEADAAAATAEASKQAADEAAKTPGDAAVEAAAKAQADAAVAAEKAAAAKTAADAAKAAADKANEDAAAAKAAADAYQAAAAKTSDDAIKADAASAVTDATAVAGDAAAAAETAGTKAAAAADAVTSADAAKAAADAAKAKAEADAEAAKVKDGDTATVGGADYKVLSASAGTVIYTKAPNKKSVSVPATVKIKGQSYKVVQIAAKAFKAKKVRTVTIGKNVKTIKKYAFKSSKATKLIVKTKKLTKKSVKGSLKGSKVKTVKVKVGSKKVNNKYVKKYKKIFTKKNAGKKVKVTK